jgi:hypothetical protein
MRWFTMFPLDLPFQTQTVAKMSGLYEAYLLNVLTKRPMINFTHDYNYSTVVSSYCRVWRTTRNCRHTEIKTKRIVQILWWMWSVKRRENRRIMRQWKKWRFKTTFSWTRGSLAAKTHGKCAISRRNTQTRIPLGMWSDFSTRASAN